MVNVCYKNYKTWCTGDVFRLLKARQRCRLERLERLERQFECKRPKDTSITTSQIFPQRFWCTFIIVGRRPLLVYCPSINQSINITRRFLVLLRHLYTRSYSAGHHDMAFDCYPDMNFAFSMISKLLILFYVDVCNSTFFYDIIVINVWPCIDYRSRTQGHREASRDIIVEETSRNQHTIVGSQGTFNRHTMSYIVYPCTLPYKHREIIKSTKKEQLSLYKCTNTHEHMRWNWLIMITGGT